MNIFIIRDPIERGLEAVATKIEQLIQSDACALYETFLAGYTRVSSQKGITA